MHGGPMTGPTDVPGSPDWEVRQGDCMDPVDGLPSLVDLSVDVVITDPPYSKRVHQTQRRGLMSRERRGSEKAAGGRKRELGFGYLQDDLRSAVATELARLTWRWILVFSDLESTHLWQRDLVASGLEHVQVGIWHKLGATPQFRGDRPAVAAEAVEISHPAGRKRWNGGGGHAFWEHPIVLDRGGRGGVRVHTTQKPLELMEELVLAFTEPGELVLDPFCGSGTTGIACRKHGRRFVGWEKDARYAELARERIAGVAISDPCRRQIDLFALRSSR